MRVARVPLVASADMSVDITSNPQQLNQAFGYAIQANYATNGSLGGALKLQASVDYNAVPFGVTPVTGNWVDIANSSVTLTGAGSYIWNVSQVMYPWVRVVYTHLGGDAGSLDVFVFERAF